MRFVGITSFLFIVLVSSAVGQTLNAAQRLEAWEKTVASMIRRSHPTQREMDGASYEDTRLHLKNALLSLPKSKFLPAAYHDFLKQSNSGVVRLFSSIRLRTRPEVRRKGTEKLFIGGVPGDGFSYSIRRKEHTYQLLSDFTLDGENLVFGGAFNQSLVADLGNVEPGSVEANHSAVRDILTFQPSTVIETVLKKEAEIEKGIKLGDYSWTRSVPTRTNVTYLARVIAYDNIIEKKKDGPGRAARFSFLREDERRDFVFVFRVVAIEDDGGVTLIYRELIRNKSPILVL